MARQCSICDEYIEPKEKRSIVALKVKHYLSYNRDLTQPDRRQHVYCHECTRSFVEWLNHRVREVAQDRAEYERKLLAISKGHSPTHSQ